MKIGKQEKIFKEGGIIRIKPFDKLIPHLEPSRTVNGEYYTKNGIWIPESMVKTFGEIGQIEGVKNNGNLSIRHNDVLWLFESWMVE